MRLSKLYPVVLVVALIAAAALVVVLARQQQALVDRVESLTTRVRDPYPGFYVPALTLRSVSGDSVRLGEATPGNVQLFFVFSTTCDHCRASLQAWNRVASEFAQDPHVEVYGISIDSAEVTRTYVAEHHLQFPVVSFADRKLQALYRSNVFPQTLVIDAEGRVRYARLGALTGDSATDSIVQLSRSIGPSAEPAR